MAVLPAGALICAMLGPARTMMIEHLVLFKLKPEATAAQIDTMITQLQGLAQQIDTVRELSCGRNFSPRGEGFAVGLRVKFDDRAGLEFYGPHDAHQSCVATYIKPIMDSVVVVDFEA